MKLVSMVIFQLLYELTVSTDDTVHRGNFTYQLLINIHKPLS